MKNIRYDFIYLGFALSCFANLTFLDWKFYAIFVPFTILNIFKNEEL